MAKQWHCLVRIDGTLVEFDRRAWLEYVGARTVETTPALPTRGVRLLTTEIRDVSAWRYFEWCDELMRLGAQ